MKLALVVLALLALSGCSTIMCHVANHEYGPAQTAYPCR